MILFFLAIMLMLKVHYVTLKFIAKNTYVFYQQNSSNQDYMFSLGDGKRSLLELIGPGGISMAVLICSGEKL